MEKEIYNLSPQEVFEKFDTNLGGLSEVEAQKRLKYFGSNGIKREVSWRWVKLIFNQFNDALVWILLVAATLAFIFQEYRDVTIILIIVLINASIGFFQEFKAERTLEKIRNIATGKAIVIRNKEKKEISTEELAPGDVVYVSEGNKIPADGYLLESFSLKINSFIFTGESKPRVKKSEVLLEKNLSLADMTNMVFMGETVVLGEGLFVVTATGAQTELGRIAKLTKEVETEATPMQKQMRVLGREITGIAVLIAIIVMIAGQYFHMSLYQNFLFALALAVSVVPEGLPAAISVVLSVGMKRLLKDNVLAKKLTSVETLGSVSIICTDKTGTITKNELMVTKIIINDSEIELDGEGYDPNGNFYLDKKEINPRGIKNLDLLFKIGALCNDASLVQEAGEYKIIGDPTEGAIVVAGKKFDPHQDYFSKEKKIDEIPFSSERRRMSVIYENNRTISFVKGSPDVIIDLCDFRKVGDKIIPFTAKDREKMKDFYNQMSAEALRVLAFAYRDLGGIPQKNFQLEAEKNMVWVGMMAMIDPPRRDVKQAIQECQSMGVKVLMITGDYEITAEAIAKKAGLISETYDSGEEYEVINGKKLNELSDEQIIKIIKHKEVVFARTAPEQKLRIATLLKKNGFVIAMTGDGVNDAPALKKADIGVAMGKIGTDVSKEAADMILLDDNFASIVKGVKEGRTIYQNLKKFVQYVLSSNASELLTVVFGVILQVPSPITAIQILAVDLGTDIFPSFALGLEPAEPGLSKSKIHNAKEPLINAKGFKRIGYIGVLMALGGITAFLWSMYRGGWRLGESIDFNSILYIKSTTATFAVLAMTQMANMIELRSEKYSVFKVGFFRNKYIFIAFFISLGLLLSFMYVPLLQRYMGMMPIDLWDWLLVVGATLVVFIFEELRKIDEK